MSCCETNPWAVGCCGENCRHTAAVASPVRTMLDHGRFPPPPSGSCSICVHNRLLADYCTDCELEQALQGAIDALRELQAATKAMLDRRAAS